MKSFYLIFSILTFLVITSILFVTLKFKSELIFAPDIFLTEMFKFVCMTVLWTFIIQYYLKLSSLKKKENSINVLLLSNINLIIYKIKNNNLKENELQQSIDLISDNIKIISTRLNTTFSPEELNQFSQCKNNLTSQAFAKALEKVEYSIRHQTGYKNLDEYDLIITQLTQLANVFENKKK